MTGRNRLDPRSSDIPISIAFDRCQWQWCEITSGFESNPILASSLNGTPWPLHRKLLFSLLEGYCHGDLLDSISWRTINSGNCWCLQIPRAECFHSLAYTKAVRLIAKSCEVQVLRIRPLTHGSPWRRVAMRRSLARLEVVIAFDSNRSPEDGGGSGREVLERAPSRTNGVPDDTPDCPSPI